MGFSELAAVVLTDKINNIFFYPQLVALSSQSETLHRSWLIKLKIIGRYLPKYQHHFAFPRNEGEQATPHMSP